MEFVLNFWFGILILVAINLLFYFRWLVPKVTSRPPGPPCWPIVGSLFYLSKIPHRSMENLAKKYGPIMYLRLGCLDHIIVSNADMAMEVLKIHDGDFASRPRMLAGKYAGFDWSSIGFSEYGDHWRLLRKICATELFTQARLNSFQHGRQHEMACMVENIAKCSQGGKFVEMRPIFLQLTRNNICRMLFGERPPKSHDILGNDFDDYFKSFSEMVTIVGKFNFSELIPILKPFDLQGLERHMKRLKTRIDNSLSNILKEYRKGNKAIVDSNVANFVEILLNLDKKLDDKSIMGVLSDMLEGGTNTSAFTLEWALLELILHPEIMKRAQEELDRVVGKNRRVFELDLPNLPYLQAIIKENFRLHPVVPLAVPHLTSKDTQILNYKIPANTIVLVNVWAIGHDPKVWKRPLEFDPDRVFGLDINVGGSNYNLLPFGSGRRRCPGLDLAQLMVQCGLATILHAFDWSLKPNVKLEDMNMMEDVGATSPLVEPLIVVAKPRLPIEIYK